MSARSAFPPRRKDWERGSHQIGLFVRMPDGSKLEVVWNRAPKAIVSAAADLFAELVKNKLRLE